MARDIKFRIWIPSNKIMMVPKSIQTLHESILNGVTIGEMKRWVYLQFTGMKDVNGKEIYEGDIVNIPIGKKKIMHKGTVIWQDTGFIADMSGSDWYDLVRDVEVIGNIYESADDIGLEIKYIK